MNNAPEIKLTYDSTCCGTRTQDTLKILWQDDSFWQLRFANGELSDYRRVVLGSGLVGTEFDRLIIADWSQPSLSTLSRLGYDGSSQFSLPTWNHVDIMIDGIIYSWENGEHDVVQTLDLRTGVAEVSDKREYAPGKRLSVAIRMFLPRQQPLTGWLSLRIEDSTEKRPIRLKFGLRGDAARGALAMDFSRSRVDCLVGVYRGVQESTPVEQIPKLPDWPVSQVADLSPLLWRPS